MISNNDDSCRVWDDGLILYHGSASFFELIDLSKARPFKDFGKGFYLTTSIVQAAEWAKGKADASDKRCAYIYTYKIAELDDTDKNSFRIMEHLSYSVEWLDLIAKCRVNGYEPEFDIIYDRMADGDLEKTVFDYMDDKLSPALALAELRKWKKDYPRDQYCFKGYKACALLKRTGTEVLEKDKKNSWGRFDGI